MIYDFAATSEVLNHFVSEVTQFARVGYEGSQYGVNLKFLRLCNSLKNLSLIL